MGTRKIPVAAQLADQISSLAAQLADTFESVQAHVEEDSGKASAKKAKRPRAAPAQVDSGKGAAKTQAKVKDPAKK